MYRILMSTGDLAQTRVIGSLGPSVESVFALDAWRTGEGKHLRSWQQRVRQLLLSRTDLSRRLTRITATNAWRTRILAGLACPADDSSAAPDDVTAVTREFRRLAVAPDWRDVSARLDAARDAAREAMARGGIEALFSRLGPHVRWRAPVLEVDGTRTGDLEPDGGGLLLSPSFFLHGTAEVVPDAGPRQENRPVLVFPAHPALPSHRPLGGEGNYGSPQHETALAALVGRTRSLMLRTLLEGYSGSELAGQLGISAAAVSQHAAVLRSAGLISTHRLRNRALHTLTPLGRSLLCGDLAPLPTG
jgi:DNA-binding transcriptional ArsR family regulator